MNTLFLILISAIVLGDLLHPGLPLTHDGQDHVARIANFYQSLSEGNIIPRWAGNLNWGYGHPILMFLYPLPSYLASFFHVIGFTLIDSTKLVFGIAFIASGLTMYLWINDFLGKRAAFVAAMLYMFAPYRFIDLYVRGAIGEHVAFVFPPLIMYFLLKLSKRYSPWFIIGGALSMSGLILSHNAISLMFLPILVLYAAYFLWQSDQKRVLLGRFGILGILGIGLSTFFWMPAFFEGKYTLRDIVTAGDFASRFVPFGSFLYGSWSYGGTGDFSTQVGIVQWVLVFASLWGIYVLYKRKNDLWILGCGSLVVFIFSLFIMTSVSAPIWNTITTLQKFQFPWRFLSVIVFATSLLGATTIFASPKKYQIALCIVITIFLLLINQGYWYAKGYLNKPESFFTGIYPGTTDTGESSPIWSVRFMEKEPPAHIEVIDGNAAVKELKRTLTVHEYEIDAKSKVKIRENTLYFPGWQIFIDGKPLATQSIEFQDQNSRGIMTFFVPQGIHSVTVAFFETKLRIFANSISVVSLLLLTIFAILRGRKYGHTFGSVSYL